MGTEENSSRARVEPPKGKPKPARGATTKKHGAITAKHVEGAVVQIGAIAALLTNKPWYAVNRPDIEVEPWSENAAELLAEIPADYAERFTKYNAAVSVTVGISMMIVRRARMDQEQAQKAVTPARQAQQAQQAKNAPPVTHAPAQEAERADLPPQRSTVPGTGARPTHPAEPISGMFTDSMTQTIDTQPIDRQAA